LSKVLEHLTAALRRGEAVTLVTVVMAKGSGPRNPGAHMLVLADGSISGTVGGGELEWQAIEEAKARTPGVWRKDFVLGPDLGQCCGGRMTLQFELCLPVQLPTWQALLQDPEALYWTVFDRNKNEILRRKPSPELLETLSEDLSLFYAIDENSYLELFAEKRMPLFLFGAGHIGKALTLSLAALPIKVTWLDNRPEIFPSLMPRSITTKAFTSAPDELAVLPEKSAVLVMTHDHSLDLEICLSALQNSSCIFLGLIGSATKRARFIKRLSAAGITGSQLDKFQCPIGVGGITSKEPTSIAASVAAQLLQLRERLLNSFTAQMDEVNV
jgi:xanthine dehydrogenase accessory factor